MDYSNTRKIIELNYSSRLSMHKATQAMYFDDRPFNLAEFRDAVFQEQQVILDDDKCIKEIAFLCAKKNVFSPIEDYLNRCRARYPRLTYERVRKVLELFSRDILHISEPLEKGYLTKTLVAAAKRIYEPGCQHDTVLIIRSNEQGLYKTSFFTELAGTEWFTSLTLKHYDKDELMICHSKWMIELGECEETLKSYAMSKLKAFVTKRSDPLRYPYADRVVNLPRHFILVGTTNQSKFLQDETGNRRFWVIDINKKIDIAKLKKHRDLIWAAAVVAYQNNHPTYLNEAEQRLSNAANAKKYKEEDLWTEPITNWVHSQTEGFTLTDVMTEAIGKEPKDWTRNDAKRVKGILHSLGIEHPTQATRVNGKPGKYYACPANKDVASSNSKVTT